MELARELRAEIAPAVGTLLPVAIEHCARAKESSVWMPCKELAPYLAATAPSARALDSILAYAGRDTAAAVAATKHAGCREAAGLSLLEMLLAAIREGGSSAEAAPKPSARAVVLPRTSDIGAAVVSLVTDASVVRGHCPPDIRTAGVDCFRALQTLDGTAAGAAYKQLEAKHPRALLDRLGKAAETASVDKTH